MFGCLHVHGSLHPCAQNWALSLAEEERSTRASLLNQARPVQARMQRRHTLVRELQGSSCPRSPSSPLRLHHRRRAVVSTIVTARAVGAQAPGRRRGRRRRQWPVARSANAARCQICREGREAVVVPAIDARKLLVEATAHAVQNERLPVRCVVQVLFSEHGSKLTRLAMDHWLLPLRPGTEPRMTLFSFFLFFSYQYVCTNEKHINICAIFTICSPV
uniref:NPH3 domain-containing protein n=1 Tax=Oryza brachyantha TaxID=4533 RepID=J3LI89_ORYBR